MVNYKPHITALLLCFTFCNCVRSGEETPVYTNNGRFRDTTTGTPNKQEKVIQWYTFKQQSDSLLELSQKEISAFKKEISRPKNRHNIVKKRRDIIKAEYQLDILKERLDKRNGEYAKAAKKLNSLDRTNSSFQNEFTEGFCELDSTISQLR